MLAGRPRRAEDKEVKPMMAPNPMPIRA